MRQEARNILTLNQDVSWRRKNISEGVGEKKRMVPSAEDLALDISFGYDR